MRINRVREVVNQDKITPSLCRELVGLVVRLREQKISMERLRLERARFELDVADLVMKHLDRLKASGVLQIEDRGEAAKKSVKPCSANTPKSRLKALVSPLRNLLTYSIPSLDSSPDQFPFAPPLKE